MNISVIYVAYRTPPEMLEHSISSVRVAAAQASVDVEIVIADNGGGVQYAEAVDDVVVVGNGENVGFGSAVNSALRASGGEHVLLMNPDSVVEPELFDELIGAMTVAPERSFFGALLVKDGRPQVHAYNVWSGSIELALRKSRWTTTLDAIVKSGSPAEVTRLCGAGLFATRAALVELGPFDESFFLYGEDVDLSLRAKSMGYSLSLVPRAVIRHDAGTSSPGASRLVEQARTDGHLRILANHRNYAVNVFARLEVVASALAGAVVTRDRESRRTRLARVHEVLRWGLKREAPRFDPAGAVH